VNTASCTERKVKLFGSCTDKTLGLGDTEKDFSPMKFHLRRSTIYKYTMTDTQCSLSVFAANHSHSEQYIGVKIRFQI